MYDFLIANGTVIDPATESNERRNVAIKAGRIAALLETTAPCKARQTLDCTGQLVVPGLIDFHVHVFPGVSNFGVDPDETCLARGVTTVLDFGTAGGLIFDLARSAHHAARDGYVRRSRPKSVHRRARCGSGG